MGHGVFGEVAGVGGLPLVVLDDEHDVGESDDRAAGGKIPATFERRWIFLIGLSGFVNVILLQWA